MNKITTIYDKPLNNNGEWELTQKEYNSINSDYKGTSNGIPQAMRMVNGMSRIVNVKIIV